MKHKIKNDILLAAGILVLAAALFLVHRLTARQPAAIAEISVDGTVIHEFPLDIETEFVIYSENHGENHLIIHEGQADITSATCPDKICVKHAPVSESGQTIVCLPNKMVVTIK